MPCLVHEAEVAVRASVCGHDGGDVCAHGVCPALQPVVGTGRWALRGVCGVQDTLPSDTRREEFFGCIWISTLIYISFFLFSLCICLSKNRFNTFGGFIFLPF